MQTLTFQNANQYSLIDSGGFQKLERFGDYVLVRPEPQAVWQPNLPAAEWEKRAHAFFEQQGSHTGKWRKVKEMPDQWIYSHTTAKWFLRFRLGLTGFKHIGVFPEQAVNWEYIIKHSRRLENPRVLNLFAYTGGATLAARLGGADVIHLDAVKQVVNWANENMLLNKLNGVRWVVEDALAFIKREVKRGKTYQGILLDPPSFGHGPNGERWKIEDNIDEMTALTAKLLDREKGFLVLNCYSIGFSALILDGLVRTHFKDFNISALEIGELYLQEQVSKRRLPAGVFARLSWGE